MQEDAFSPLPSATLRDRVVALMRQAIVSGEYAPGAFINQADLAKQLGISRSPLREALGQLEEEGLITVVPYKGAYVTELTPEFIDELYTLRAVLEEFAVRRAVEFATREGIAELNALLARMQAAAETEDSRSLVQVDLDFHGAIVALADHTLLLQTWRGLETNMRRMLAQRYLFYPNLRDAIGTHPDLIAAIAAHDVDRAVAVMRAHILDARAVILRTWGQDTPPATTGSNGVAH